MSKIESIKINDIFCTNEYKFRIPIYQRNYAWTEDEIYTLIDDIILRNDRVLEADENVYYLGTIVSYKKEDGIYDVIDGQQRLTTLYLIFLYLENYSKQNNILENDKLIQNELNFEARKRYIDTLKSIKNNEEIAEDKIAAELIEGYNLIKKYFENISKNKEKINIFIDKIKTTEIVIITVPKNTDLNNYFKIMNTRGEQLELHHIAKASFMDKVGNDNDRKIIAKIWDACSNMDNHVQRNFEKKFRSILFSEDLLSFANNIEKNPKDINKTWDILAKNIEVTPDDNKGKNTNTIKNIITQKDIIENTESNKGDNSNSYNSILSFPYFLLYVNATLLQDDENIDKLYDDKNLLENLKSHLNSPESIKKFIYHMLQCRFIFDKYIVKKESLDYTDNTELVLMQYKLYENGGGYVNTFSDSGAIIEDNIEKKYTLDNLIKLQSTLRYTYISQRNMKWITKVLKYIINKENELITLEEITDLLERYCVEKIKNIDYNKLSYGNVERIVFTYLDYVLYRDNFKDIKTKLKDWVVKSRNSIEHFYPQNPENNEKWDDYSLNCFGNLALITPSANSKFSNLDPKAKIVNIKNIEQSLKLKIMASYIDNEENWTPDMAREHEKEMVTILQNEINRVLSKEEV